MQAQLKENPLLAEYPQNPDPNPKHMVFKKAELGISEEILQEKYQDSSSTDELLSLVPESWTILWEFAF